MKVVIGVLGEKGSGKETFTNLLKKLLPDKKIELVRTSDAMRKTLDLWNLPVIRENYSKLVIEMEKTFGEGTLARAAHSMIDKSTADIVIVDGIRRIPELDLVRSFQKNFLIYITADVKVRFERIISRGEKSNEKEMTFENFLKEESLETEQLIYKMGKTADLKLENNGSLSKFRISVNDFCNKNLK